MSMHVVGDFLKRRIAPLQTRARLSCWFSGSNELGRIHRGPGTDLSWEELELLVKGVIGESFVPETLIPPEGIPPLYNDQGLRAAILDWLPTLDESGVAVHQTGGWDPHRGIQILGVPAGGSQPTDAGPRVPPRPSAPQTRAKGLQAVLPPRVVLGGRKERGGTDCAASTGLPSRTRPLIWSPLEASEDSWRGRGGRLPGPGRAEACQPSTSTTIRPAATATTIWFVAATPRAAAARTATTTAGAAGVPLPGSLEGSGPQVSVAPPFFTGLVIVSMGINPSFAYQGLLPLCSQSRSHRWIRLPTAGVR
jgi:hypothetical protein